MDINYYKQYEPLFGSWKIVRLIGEGSFGKVFEVERQDIKKTYKAALKAITIPASENELREVMLDGGDEESAKEYFRSVVDEVTNEFDLMAQMKGNSNIVSYEDHVIIEHKDGIGWDILIRMELLTPLNKHYKENGMTKTDVIRLGIDMCRALEVCKKNNVVHRDIKPENIFVSPNGDYKLGDFGVAKSLENANNSFSKKGTGFYMAPEVYKGRKYDRLVDIYSVGLVMYRYLNNNVLPFLPQSNEAVTYKKKEEALERRMSGEPLPLPVVVDDALFSVIRRACSYYPQDRYVDPSDMRRELERILAREESIDNYSDGFSFDEDAVIPEAEQIVAEPKKDKRNGKKFAVIAAVAALAIVAVLAVVLFGKGGNQNAETQASEPSATVAVQSPITEDGVTEITALTETSSELTTLPNIFAQDEYIPTVSKSDGSVKNYVYVNEWANVRLPINNNYFMTYNVDSNGLRCLFRMKKINDSAVSVLIDESGAILTVPAEQYFNEEILIQTAKYENSGYSVSIYQPPVHVMHNGIRYTSFVLKVTNRWGTYYSGYYYRKVVDDMVVINTFASSADEEQSQIRMVSSYK